MLKDYIVSELRKLADRIETGNCELSDSQAMEVMSVISHEALSKAEACKYLNISRSKFDRLIKEGTLPKGRKRKGFKELVWYKDDLFNVSE